MALSSTNPLIAQGNLNRLLTSLQVVSFPQLNITASYLGKRGIEMRRASVITDYIETMTGAVVSGAPYQKFEVTAHLLRTQPLASLWESQLQLSSQLGDLVLRGDTTQLPPFQLTNSAIITVGPFTFDGLEPDYPLELAGYYVVNNSLFT